MATAIKSGANITFTGTGDITLAQIASDINDAAFCTWDGVTKKFRVNCTVYRAFTIPNGVRVIVGSESDYSYQEIFEVYTTLVGAVEYFRIVVDPTGSFCMYGNCIFDGLVSGSAANTYNVLFWIWGGLYLIGNASFPVFVHHFRGFTFTTLGYGKVETSSITKDIIIDYLKIDYLIGSFIFIYNPHVRLGLVSITNLTLLSTTSAATNLLTGAGDLSKAVISGITIGDNKRVYRLTGQTILGLFKISNTVIETNKWASGYLVFTQGTNFYHTYKTYYARGNPSIFNTNQLFQLYDNVTFNDQGYSYFGYMSYKSVTCLKDCTFPSANRGWLLYEDSKLLLWGANTGFQSGGAVGDSGSIQYVQALYLTITDLNDNPLQDVIVTVNQSQGYEYFWFRTGADGKPDDVYGYKAILLTWKSQYRQSLNELWSDNSNGTYHTVTVTKAGYKPYTFNVVMDQDRTVAVSLKKIRQQIAISTKGNLTVLSN